MKILVADDHLLIFNGIQTLFEGVPPYEVLPEPVGRLADLLPALQRQSPDVLLLDINLRGDNALDLLPEIKRDFPKLRVFVISTYTQNTLLERATEGGAEGFLTKDLTLDELRYAFAHGQPGKPYISADSGALQPEKYHRRAQAPLDPFAERLNLSKRELEIIRFVVAGLTTEAIAETLYLSPHTVHTHRRNILTKLGLHSTAELVKWAYENRLV
jgi:DNA-binding NarL/FixJ family response regulator